MRLFTWFGFPRGSIDGQRVDSLLSSDLGFRLDNIISTSLRIRRASLRDGVPRRVREAAVVDSLRAYGSGEDEVDVMLLGRFGLHQISFATDQLVPDTTLEKIACWPGMTGGGCHPQEDIVPAWSAESATNPSWKAFYPMLVVHPSWRMWLGSYALKLFGGMEHVHKFRGAYRLEKVAADVLYVELWRDPRVSGSKESRAVQRAFREWVGMDKLVRQGHGVDDQPHLGDPSVDIRSSGEGVDVTSWFDEKGQPTARSAAKAKRSFHVRKTGPDSGRR